MKKYLSTLIVWLLIVWICSQEGGMIIFILVLPFTILYLLMLLCRLFLKKMSLRQEAIKIAIIAMGSMVVIIVQEVREENARKNADEMVTQIEAFRAKNGKYPEEPLTQKRIHYHMYQGEPHLFYPSTKIIFDKYHYDFKEKAWIFLPD